MLNSKQKEACDLITAGRSVFLTGPAGCGKSYIIRQLRELPELASKNIVITSSTGVSAVNLGCGAMTLHSWFGIGPSVEQSSMQYTLSRIKNAGRVEDIRSCNILVIDEISMISLTLFEILCEILREVRKCRNHPTGGVQLITSGDFLQLEPVKGKFCFLAPTWEQIYPRENIVYLTQPMRQRDANFYKILMDVRTGDPSPETVEALKSRVNVKLDGSSTKIVSLNAEAERINSMYLERCKKAIPNIKLHRYRAITCGPHRNKIAKYVIAPEKLELAAGLSVMLLANLSVRDGICNGASGRVIRFQNNLPVVRFKNGIERTIGMHSWDFVSPQGKTFFKQIPLKLLYGSSFHKTQGMTIDKAYLDLGDDVFARGQAYVGLSRVRCLEDLSLVQFNPEQIRANQRAVEFYDKLN